MAAAQRAGQLPVRLCQYCDEHGSNRQVIRVTEDRAGGPASTFQSHPLPPASYRMIEAN